ncbi:hypothetical protein KQI52_15365 [bacterium]|nr:hypothetical protein [bacterium]
MLTQHLSGQMLRDPVNPGSAEIREIRNLPNPPLVDLKADDIHVRRCRLASDAVDSRFGRFRTKDMPRVLELLRGAPVLIGHDKRTLGVARFFGGTVENRDGVSWVVPSFYWPREHSGAEDLRVMIDSGVYSEASIAFTYRTPTCSVCGNDIRGCAHWPGRTYDNQLCFFYYDGIERVTEGSLVYRGAAYGTGFELPAGSNESENATPDIATETSPLDSAAINLAPAPDPDEAGPTLTLKHHGRRYLAILRPLKEE